MSEKPSEVFVIFRKGVYRHEVMGVYSDQEQAIEEARVAHSSETDSYHDMEVWRFEVDKPTYSWNVKSGYPFLKELGDRVKEISSRGKR